MKQVPMTDEELDILIKILIHANPTKDEESILFNFIGRLRTIRNMT